MYKIGLSFCLLISVLAAEVTFAQRTKLAYNFNIYNSNLPSNTIYNIKCDKAGNLWIATDKGLVKYDGTNFKVFNLQNGFPDNEVVNLFYDEAINSIWCLTYNSKIAKVNCTTDRVTNLNPPQEILGAFMYAFKQNGNLKFLTANQLFTYQNNSFLREKLPEFTFRDYLLSNPTKIKNLNTQLYKEVKWNSIQSTYFNDYVYVWAKINTRISNYNTLLFNKEIFTQKNGKIYQLLDLKNLLDDPTAFIVDIAIKDNDLILAINGKLGGIYCAYNFFNNPNAAKLTLISQNSTSASVCIDKIGNIWYALDKGLFVASQQQFNVSLTRIENAKYLQKDTRIKAKNDDLVFINNLNKDDYITIANDRLNQHYKTATANNAFVGSYKNTLTSNIKDVSHNDSLFFYNEWILQASDNYKYILPNSFSNYNKYFTIRKGDSYKNYVLTIGSNDSLYLLNNSLKKVTYKSSAKIFGNVNSIYFLNNNYILFCASNGVFSSDISFRNIKQISNKNYKKAIISDNITYFINDHEVAYNDDLNGNTITTIFSNKNFLSGFTITDFDISKNKIHLLTDIGYVVLNKVFITKKPTPIAFSLVSLDLKDSIYYQIDTSINIKAINFKQIKFGVHFFNPENNFYQKSYSFVKAGINDNWIDFIGNEFLQTNLSAGNYTLKIKAKLVEIGEEKTITYQIKIEPKFWQTNWFIVCCILLAIGLVSLITWLFLSKSQQKKLDKIELERKIADIENRAFLNQLNPHFLYNALNTLQDYIIKKDTHNGILYLQRVTSLHRNILEFNQKNYITVADECTFLEKYLFVQQKRYSDKFKFEVTANHQALALKLPPMLLQPLVENAIEHGFTGKEAGKFMSVTFEKKLGALCIKIKDNGNGNIANILPFREGHALKMIKERLDFINQKTKTNINTIAITANKPKGISIAIIIDL